MKHFSRNIVVTNVVFRAKNRRFFGDNENDSHYANFGAKMAKKNAQKTPFFAKLAKSFSFANMIPV